MQKQCEKMQMLARSASDHVCTLISWTLLTTPTEVRHKSTIGARNKSIVSGKLDKPKRDLICIRLFNSGKLRFEILFER